MHFGFRLPDDMLGPYDGEGRPVPGGGVRDSVPYPGFCSFCKREMIWTYALGDGRRMCRTDLDETIRVKDKRALWRRIKKVEIPVLPSEKIENEVVKFDVAFWNRWL